jgi:processive 1,2-diacylglycerol beta-glucosyltransferase
MTHRPRFLVLTLSFGSGHLRAAQAVAAAIKRRHVGADVEVVDVLAGCQWLFRAFYVWPYWAMVRYAPSLWKRLFEWRLRHLSRQTAPAWAFRWGCASAFKAISRFRPDVIVAAEVAACEIAVLARRGGLTHAPIMSVITDYHAEPAWVHPEVAAYAVADHHVLGQLRGWGAPEDRIHVSGIPIDPSFGAVRRAPAHERPVVLLMGGGMGPTRMDLVAAHLIQRDVPMHVVGLTGHDLRARRRTEALDVATSSVTLTVRGWTDDVLDLMRSADILVTKPGGLTTAEAAACGLPMVLFDPIPGPEQHNAARAVAAGAAVMTRGAAATADAVISLVHDRARLQGLSKAARILARSDAADVVADFALRLSDAASAHPVLILTISNGAGHTSVAEAVAQELRDGNPPALPLVVDVAAYMTPLARFTHLTLYLWLVRYTPALWARIDRYQKQQVHTSPEWYYRRGCRRLFALVRTMRPRAIVVTEVGCAEIAALIKRDLALPSKLIAVNAEYDADRAWIQPEIDVYCTATAQVRDDLSAHGAVGNQLRVLGVPLAREFRRVTSRVQERADVCRRFNLDPVDPIVLVSGGSEGLGGIDGVVARLLKIPSRAGIIVLAGRNARLKAACDRLALEDSATRVRVLGWTNDVAELMRAAELMVSKLGHTFDEALATGLPVVALEPPPGSERVQYSLLDRWGVGRAVRSLDEMAIVVERLLADRSELEAMRRAAARRRGPDAAQHIAAIVMSEGAAS